MSTVSDLVADAMSKIGEGGVGNSLSAADAQTCLRECQRMVDSWANEGLMVYNTTEQTKTLTSGTASYASSGWSPTTRPVSIQNLFLRLDSIDYVVEPVDEATYDSFAYKPATGIPCFYFLKPAMPAATLYFYPTPDAAYVAHIKARYPLMTGMTLATTISLPPGYEAALVDNLAVRIAPHFGLSAMPAVQLAANEGKHWLRTINYQPIEMTSPFGRDTLPSYIRIQSDL